MKGNKIVLLKSTAIAIIGILTCFCRYQLPILPQGRADVITCKVNGNPWTSDATVSKNNLRVVLYRDKSLHLHAKAIDQDQENKVLSTISFFITSVNKPGIYPLGLNPKNSGDYANFETSPSSFYLTNQGSTGFVRITQLDSTNRIIAGSFEYKALALGQSSHSVQIREGKFNVSY